MELIFDMDQKIQQKGMGFLATALFTETPGIDLTELSLDELFDESTNPGEQLHHIARSIYRGPVGHGTLDLYQDMHENFFMHDQYREFYDAVRWHDHETWQKCLDNERVKIFLQRGGGQS